MTHLFVHDVMALINYSLKSSICQHHRPLDFRKLYFFFTITLKPDEPEYLFKAPPFAKEILGISEFVKFFFVPKPHG